MQDEKSCRVFSYGHIYVRPQGRLPCGVDFVCRDAIVLGYTNPNKPQNAFSGAIREEWEILHSLSLKDRLAYPREKAQMIVDAVCNTETGHSIFQEYLQSANLPGKIHFVPQVLSHLNDAHGIELAARKVARWF